MAKDGLKKELGFFTLLSIGVGGILGSGIFGMPAVMAAVAGPSLILAIIISGIITFFLGIAYAELGSAFPISGGPYSLPRLALGNLGGFLIGWGYFLYLFIGTAAIIDIFIVYLGFYIPGLAIGGTLTPLGITIGVSALWAFTLINVFGVKWGGLYSVVTTIGKLIPLAIFFLVGLAYIKGENFTPFIPFGFTGITLGVTLFFWSFTGFEAIVMPTEEVKNPAKTIPLAMITTIVIVLVVYLLLAFVFVGMIDWKGLGIKEGDWKGIASLTSPLSDIAIGLKLRWLAAIAAIGAIIATAGAGGSWVLIQARLPFAMARDKLFWKPMASVNKKYGTPIASLIFTSILTSIIMIAIPNFASVALIASVTGVVPYAAAVLAVKILRKTKPNTKRPFKLPFVNLVTIIGFVLATYVIYWASWPWSLVGSVLMLTGYIAFFFVKKKWEFKRNMWLIAYLVGIIVIAYLGDPSFMFNNFLPIEPLGYLLLPYDLIVLTIFAILIYFWAYTENKKYKSVLK
ncbi:MAG: Aspartate-proton symporter [Candidatus Anoxychlamydiales bacterium]|nr:Aspartate-proton symporter [Candidatus Anoxychlamydiales bacterium]NGX36304.1 Aspartate-proton symporter [Candidatus Anoxychlamydiales bacterium]